MFILAVGASYLLGFGGKNKEEPLPSLTPSENAEVKGESSETVQTSSPTAKTTSTPNATQVSTQTPTPSPTSTPSPTPTPTPDNRPDLKITSYSFNHPPEMGVPFTVSVTIYNQGNSPSGDFYWEWWATTSAPNYACRQIVSSLVGHGGRVVSCTYTYGGWAPYTTKAIVDVGNLVDESNEDNNTYTQAVTPIH